MSINLKPIYLPLALIIVNTTGHTTRLNNQDLNRENYQTRGNSLLLGSLKKTLNEEIVFVQKYNQPVAKVAPEKARLPMPLMLNRTSFNVLAQEDSIEIDGYIFKRPGNITKEEFSKSLPSENAWISNRYGSLNLISSVPSSINGFYDVTYSYRSIASGGMTYCVQLQVPTECAKTVKPTAPVKKKLHYRDTLVEAKKLSSGMPVVLKDTLRRIQMIESKFLKSSHIKRFAIKNYTSNYNFFVNKLRDDMDTLKHIHAPKGYDLVLRELKSQYVLNSFKFLTCAQKEIVQLSNKMVAEEYVISERLLNLVQLSSIDLYAQYHSLINSCQKNIEEILGEKIFSNEDIRWVQ